MNNPTKRKNTNVCSENVYEARRTLCVARVAELALFYLHMYCKSLQ